MVTDSRLSGDGTTFDACTKVITLPRSDCAIAFAGYSGHAYPMMHQLSNAIEAHAPLRRGSLDIVSFKTHALKIFDGMSGLIESSLGLSSPANTDPEANFILGGYCWITKSFEVWHIKHSAKQGKFIAYPPKCVRIIGHTGEPKFSKILKDEDGNLELKTKKLGGSIVVAGDQKKVFEKRLLSKLKEKHDISHLDMEPFEVVRDMLREPRHSETIGGAPQIVKVYQYMRSAPLGVHWPDRASGSIHLQGRPCLGYERIDRWVLDPDTLWSEHPSYSGHSNGGEAPAQAEA